jgi:hypothetical protein
MQLLKKHAKMMPLYSMQLIWYPPMPDEISGMCKTNWNTSLISKNTSVALYSLNPFEQ